MAVLVTARSVVNFSIYMSTFQEVNVSDRTARNRRQANTVKVGRLTKLRLYSGFA